KYTLFPYTTLFRSNTRRRAPVPPVNSDNIARLSGDGSGRTPGVSKLNQLPLREENTRPMAKVSEEQIREALAAIEEPLLGKTLGETRSIQEIEAGRKDIKVIIELPVHNYPARDELMTRISRAFDELDEERRVDVGLTTRVRAVGGVPGKGKVPNVSNVFAVASGKGGVGKSTVAVNLALALARDGARVGLLDADVYGPSVPMMLGSNARPAISNEEKLIPPQAFGIKMMSIGFLMPPDKAL